VPSLESPGNLATRELRQVEKVNDDLILKKKDADEDYYLAPKKSLNKKSTASTGTASTTTTTTIKLPFWVMSALEELHLTMVTSTEQAKQAISDLEVVKSKFEQKQKEVLGTVDSQKLALHGQIEALKARIPNIPKEALVRVQANHEKFKKATEEKKQTAVVAAVSATH